MSQFEENRKQVFAKQLKTIMRNRKKANGKKITQQALADEIGVQRETVTRWINGKNCPLNDNLIMTKLCDYFHVPLKYFTSLIDSDDGLTIIDKKIHKALNEECEINARKIGLNSSFINFLKTDTRFADIIIRYSSVDCYLQSFSPDVPELPENIFQFISSTGEKIYPSEDMLYMLRVIQRDVLDYLYYLFQKYIKTFDLYNEKKQAINKKANCNTTETVSIRGRLIDINAKTGVVYPKPPVNVFLDMLRGRENLSIDENHILELYRSINEEGKNAVHTNLVSELQKHPTKKRQAIKEAIRKANEEGTPIPPLSEIWTEDE